jgi:hypothetical protein
MPQRVAKLRKESGIVSRYKCSENVSLINFRAYMGLAWDLEQSQHVFRFGQVFGRAASHCMFSLLFQTDQVQKGGIRKH